MPTTIKKAGAPEGPRWSDHRNRRAGYYAGLAGPAKVLAYALDVSPRRARQIIAGCPHGAPQKRLEYVDRLCREGRMNPYAATAAELEHIQRVQVYPLSDEEKRDEFLATMERAVQCHGRFWIDLLNAAKDDDPEAREGVRQYGPPLALDVLRACALSVREN